MPPKLTPEEKKYISKRNFEVSALFKKGVSLKNICDSFDLSEEDIHKIIIRPRIKKLDFSKNATKNMDGLLKSIQKLKSSGKTAKEISNILLISQKDVIEVIKEFKLKAIVECLDCGCKISKVTNKKRCAACSKQKYTDYVVNYIVEKYKKDAQFKEKIKNNSKKYRNSHNI